jgi:sugar phosphate permease
MPKKGPLHRYRRWLIYLAACLLFIFSQFYRSSIAVISPNLVHDLNLDIRSLGIISSAFFYAFAVMQIPISIYLDTIGARAIMTALSLLAAGGAVIFAWGDSSGELILGRALLGLGMACNLMGPLKLMTSWFSGYRFATLSTIFFSVGTLGNIAAATPLLWMTDLFGWRTAFLIIAALNTLVVILFFLIARDRPEPNDEPVSSAVGTTGRPPVWEGVRRLVLNRDYWLISLGAFGRYGVYAAIQALWAAPFLISAIGVSQEMTGNLLLAMSLGLVVGSPICGWMSDARFHSRKWFIVTGLGAMAAILIVLATSPGNTWSVIFFALFFAFGFFSGAGQMMYAHIKELMPLESAGAAMTGINFFTMAGVAFFLHGLGDALKWFYPQAPIPPGAFRTAFIIFGAFLTGTALMYGLTRDTSNRSAG